MVERSPSPVQSADMRTEYPFAKGVKSGCKIMAILLALLIITIPFAIWFWLKAKNGKLVFGEGGITIFGLGLSKSEWRWAEIERIGTLERRLPSAGIGGAIAAKMSGGKVALNLCTVQKNGKKRFFMVSRYENYQEIVERIANDSGLTLETVTQGLGGPKFPKAA